MAIENILGNISSVIHSTEAGEPIQDIHTFFARGRATRVVQKYSQLYTLQIVRWLTSIMFDLAFDGAYIHRIESLLGLYEPFTIFFNEDRYLRSRRTWSIYRLR